jgi:hypothetical protein
MRWPRCGLGGGCVKCLSASAFLHIAVIRQDGSPTATQRKEPFDAGGRTHGIRHQADVRIGHQRWSAAPIETVNYQKADASGRATWTPRTRMLTTQRTMDGAWTAHPVDETVFNAGVQTLSPGISVAGSIVLMVRGGSTGQIGSPIYGHTGGSTGGPAAETPSARLRHGTCGRPARRTRRHRCSQACRPRRSTTQPRTPRQRWATGRPAVRAWPPLARTRAPGRGGVPARRCSSARWAGGSCVLGQRQVIAHAHMPCP